jgi:branched-chain amino acid transport system substrate-binding protein
MRLPAPLLAASAALLLAGCGPAYDDMAAERAAYARKAEGSIVVVAIDDLLAPAYLEGVRLALDEIGGEGLLGRPLELQVVRGGRDFDSMRDTVRRIAGNPRVTAVLGHGSSSIAIPASVIYEQAGILFLPPFATVKRLTLHDFDHVLRMLPDNPTMAAQSASVAALLGYRRLAVLHSRDDYSRELAFLFEDAARGEGSEIAFRGSFFRGRDDYRALLGQLHGVDFDAVYLSTGAEAGARVLRQMRELGLDQPVIGSDGLNAESLAEDAGPAADRTIVPTVYTPDGEDSARNRAFVEAFARAHGGPPDHNAAQGYDSMHLLAALVERAGGTAPQALASTAHYAPPWVGVAGIYAFDPRGNLHGKSYRFKILRHGRWWALPGVHAPYLLDRYQRHADQASNGGAAETDLGLQTLFEEKLSRSRRLRVWLGLAHAILGFERLGLVIGPSETAPATLGLVRAVAERRGFAVETCALPPAGGDTTSGEKAETPPAAPEEAALACYSTLAMSVDALYVVPLPGLSSDYLRRLNRVLRQYLVPTFALGEALHGDYALTLALVGSGVDLDDPVVAQRFDGVLNGMKVHDLNRKLANLPSLSLDLPALQDLGYRPPPEVLMLVSHAMESARGTPAEGDE